jgi:hypothetical protein
MPIRRTSNRSSYDSGFYNPEVYSNVGSRVVGYDSDALVYINAVEAADGQALEGSVKDAYNTFVVGCKSDGIWSAIKASCIMAGARTLSGALVPLVGIAPSGFNLASGTYSRVNGLKGDGAAMYLSSNRNNNADPQNSFHLSVWASTAATSAINEFPAYIGYDALGPSKTGLSHIGRLDNNSTSLYVRARMSAPAGEFDAVTNQGSATGFIALNRASSTTYTARAGRVNTVFTRTSATAQSGNIGVFYAQNVSTHSNARIAFYSIGESLDLALLDTRVSGLMVAISGAIA